MAQHHQYRAWFAAMDLSRAIHSIAPLIDIRKAPGLRAQLLASVDSIHANIAEAAGLGTPAQLLRGLRIALGSALETGSHLIVCRDSAGVPFKEWRWCNAKVIVVTAMLNRLIFQIHRRALPPPAVTPSP